MGEPELFVIDTDVAGEDSAEVKPQYEVDHSLVADDGEASSGEEQDKYVRGSCWNCGKGGHSLRECAEEADYAKIEKQRKLFMNNKPSGSLSKRYHDDKFSRFRAGYVSRALREALGLRRNEVPCFVYAMRVYGYPPGWLAEAKISSSGMNMYGTTGKRIPEPDEEEGEIIRKTMKYDVEKLIEFPGFNVPLREGCKDDHRKLGYPPMKPDHSKEAFIKYLEELSSREVEEEPYNNSPDRRGYDMESGEISLPVTDDDGPIRMDKRRQVVPTKRGLVVHLKNNLTPSGRSSSSASGDYPATRGSPQPGPSTRDNSPPPIGPAPRPPSPPAPPGTEGGSPPVVAGPSNLSGSPPCPASPVVGPKTPRGTPPASPVADSAEPSVEPSADEQPVTSPAVKRSAPDVKDDGELDEGPSPKKFARLSTENESMEVSKEEVLADQLTSPDVSNTTPATPAEKSMVSEEATPTSVYGTPTTHVGPIPLGTPNIKKHSPFTKLPSYDDFGKNISDVIDFENLPDYVGKYKTLCSVVDKIRDFMASKNKKKL